MNQKGAYTDMTFEKANEIAKIVNEDEWVDMMYYVLDEVSFEPSICHKCKRWYDCNICNAISGMITKCNYMVSESK